MIEAVYDLKYDLYVAPKDALSITPYTEKALEILQTAVIPKLAKKYPKQDFLNTMSEKIDNMPIETVSNIIIDMWIEINNMGQTTAATILRVKLLNGPR